MDRSRFRNKPRALVAIREDRCFIELFRVFAELQE